MSFKDDINQGLTIKSVYGKGSVFSFTIENKLYNNQDQRLEIFSIPLRFPSVCFPSLKFRYKCDHPKILIVDDDEFNIISLNLLLERLGFNAEWTNNGKSAI